MIKTCESCRRVGCRNYGSNFPACTKYIIELTTYQPSSKKENEKQMECIVRNKCNIYEQ